MILINIHIYYIGPRNSRLYCSCVTMVQGRYPLCCNGNIMYMSFVVSISMLRSLIMKFSHCNITSFTISLQRKAFHSFFHNKHPSIPSNSAIPQQIIEQPPPKRQNTQRIENIIGICFGQPAPRRIAQRIHSIQLSPHRIAAPCQSHHQYSH